MDKVKYNDKDKHKFKVKFRFRVRVRVQYALKGGQHYSCVMYVYCVMSS